jgi:hypothetical protein
MAQRILALEYTGDEVHAAVAERAWSTFALVGTFSEARTDGESDLAPALTRLLGKAGKPDITISAFPAHLTAKRVLELPFRDRRRLDQAVPFALEEHLPFSVDDAVVAYCAVGRESDKTIVVAAMARKDDLRRHLELLAQAGLDPKTVTLGSLALSPLLSHLRNGGPHPHLVLDIGDSRTSLLLLDEKGTPRALRTFAAPYEIGSGGPQLGPGAPILSAIRQTLLARPADAEHADVIVTGSLAASAEIRKELASSLSLAVYGVDEIELNPVFDGLTLQSMGHAACVSMLLSELPSAPAPLLNFRQGEFAFHGLTFDLAPLKTSARLAAAVLFVALLHLSIQLSTGWHQLTELQHQINQAAAPAFGPVVPANVKAALIERMADMTKRMRLIGGGLSGGPPLDVLLALSRALPEGLSLNLDELSIDDGGLKLAGKTDSFGAVDSLKKALAQSHSFDGIEVTDAKGGATPGTVEFRLSATPLDNEGAN